MKYLLFFLFILILSAVGFGGWFVYENIQAVSTDKNFTDFLITKGQSGAAVANKLQTAGLIKSALVFKTYIRLTGQSSKIQAGEFRLSPSMSMLQIVDELQKGPVEIWVTIPEGLRREEIANKFASELNKDQKFIDEFLSTSQGEEGYLFPETYLFPKDVSASVVVKKMLDTFESKTSPFNLTRDQVILASILERETKTDEERPVVAGILMNRLEIGMPLQVDASVQYGLGTAKDWWPVLLREDLQTNSQYNTYKFQGLPPSPISNPGISSLKAAANPIPNDYWYYIHDTQGQIHYAKSLNEHNENVAKYLR